MAEIYESDFGNYVIEVSDDKFSAYLTIAHRNDFLSEKELVDLIAKTNISFGFDEARELVASKNIEKNYDQPFPIAIGVKPKSTEVEFSPLFDTENSYHPKLGNQFDKIQRLCKIKKGEPVAHLFVTKEGKAGMNIFGEEVDTELYENHIVENYLGDNVTHSHERGQIIAQSSGYPYMDELSRVHVKAEFVIDKNLDLTFNDMNFFGSLIVQGDIMDKIKLKIEGDLTVHGEIKDAELDINGDITVEGDIIDCKNPGIIASGNINLNSAENSKITSGGKVNFKKNLQFSRIVAENGLFGNQDSSTLVGGVYISGEHIETSVIGNIGGISTEVEISISPYTKECMLNVSKQMLKLKELNLTDSDEYNKLHDELNALEIKLENDINTVLKNQENLPKHIMAFKKIFPGTYIRILKKSMHLKEELNRVSFSIVNGDLTNEAY